MPEVWLQQSAFRGCCVITSYSIHYTKLYEKYGERAFRYCQLDVGHALGALRYAAAVLGWDLVEQRHIGHATLAARLGLDRTEEYSARRS